MKTPILYLSGPMTGIEDFNYPAFNEAARRLRYLGHVVFNPAESFGGRDSLDKETYMAIDMAAIEIASKVVLLPKWWESEGAKQEVARANERGIPVVTIESMLGRGIRVIGLVGYAGSGKDTVAEIIRDLDPSFRQVSFAEPLKAIAREIGWNGAKDEEGRKLLQNLGVAVREWIGLETWIDVARQQINAYEDLGLNVVISDVRFLNEIGMIRSLGGEIWRIERDGVDAVNDHVSEHEWQSGVRASDRIIRNNSDISSLVDVAARALFSETIATVTNKWSMKPGWLTPKQLDQMFKGMSSTSPS